MTKQKICQLDDLVANSGVCALINNSDSTQSKDSFDDQQQIQVAIFFLPDSEQKIFALGNWDPIGKANVLSRGMIGNIGKELVVASPLYKQHFSLITGKCLEDEGIQVPVFDVSLENNLLYITT